MKKFDFRLMMTDRIRPCLAGARGASIYKHRTSRGMTLIELLVVIVILTTLVGGVIPLLSPNNDTRKIREAARGLQTFITMAQAEAARSGRPYGIRFQETSLGSGVALEVYHIEVPPPFAGFSTSSSVSIKIVERNAEGNKDDAYLYGYFKDGRQYGNGGKRFSPQYNGYQLYQLQFVSALDGRFEYFPPRMLRIGDRIIVDGSTFLIIDDANPNAWPNKIEMLKTASNGIIKEVEYLVPQVDSQNPEPIYCILLNDSGQVFPPSVVKRYQVDRLPTKTAGAPFQLPASIVLDMQASIVEGSSTGGYPTDSSLYALPPNPLPTPPTPPPPPYSASIMFSPNGGVSSVFVNGQQLSTPSKIALLLGRIENGGLVNNDWMINSNASKDELEDLQEKINWLNLDSRWLSIAVNSGRVVVSENAFVDARLYAAATAEETAEAQIEASHEFAHDMKMGGGG